MGYIDNKQFHTLDIIIPTYNGGSRLIESVQMIEHQKFDGRVGIILVDSESTDGTIENLEQKANVRVIRISQKEFSHSYARNLGAENSEADVLLFMTQDAIPISEEWVAKMVEPLREGFAAVSTVDDTKNCPDLFYNVGTWRYQCDMRIYHADKVCEYHDGMSKDEIRTNSILNDVACCIPRALYLKYPFAGDYAEDLQLGKRLIQGGYKLKVLGTLGVDHYHERSQFYHLKRQYVEIKALDRIMEFEPDHIDSPQIEWTLCQTIWGVANVFDRLGLVGRLLVGRSPKSTCLFLFLVRQLLKKAEHKNLFEVRQLSKKAEHKNLSVINNENISSSREKETSNEIISDSREKDTRNENISDFWESEIRTGYKQAIIRYEYCSMPRNPIVELRDYLRTGLEPYIRENNLKPGFEEIKKCIFKEAARSMGTYLARADRVENIFPGIVEKV